MLSHINSIDKSAKTGNYLVSGRHTSTLYYVNATDHTTIWQLSYFGQSDFSCTNFNFSFQHDARLISENDTTTVLSIFDNASNGYNNSATESSGMFISIDHNAGTATLISQTFFPLSGGILTTSQGNTQLLDNGNVFHGWGDNAWISEHTPDGHAVLLAQFALDTTFNYRAFSMEWQSTPADSTPDVYTYALNDNEPTAVYVSWNGATPVAHWRFYGAQEIGEPFSIIGETLHAGFETMWMAPKFYQWVFVEALGPDGTSLRNSSFQPTFVPSAALASSCSSAGCAIASTYST